MTTAIANAGATATAGRPDLPSASGFRLFLGAFDEARFFSEHWEQRSVHIPHHDSGRFAHLISPDSLFEREVRRCGHLKASTRDREGWNVEVRIQPEQAPKMFRAGMTICASMLDETGPIGEVIAAYRSAITIAAPPHVNCYYSPDQRGYGLHFDTHPVFILQVAGSKRWTVSREPGVRNPPFNVVFPPGKDRIKLPWITLDRPDLSDDEAFMEARLDPGDVLYLPAGAWHAARAEGSSLALTLAVGRMGTLDLFDFLVVQAAQNRLRETTVRLPPLPRPAVAGAAPHREALRQRLQDDLVRLQDLVRRIDVDDLLAVYEFHSSHPETLLASRQFMAAREQVEHMKALYPSPPAVGHA